MFQSNIYRHQTFRYPQIQKNLKNQHGPLKFSRGVDNCVREGGQGDCIRIRLEYSGSVRVKPVGLPVHVHTIKGYIFLLLGLNVLHWKQVIIHNITLSFNE